MSSYGRRDLISNNNCEVCNNFTSTDLTEDLKDKLKKVVKGRSFKSKQMKTPKSAMIESTQDKGYNNNELDSKDSSVCNTYEPDCVDRALSDELMLLLHGCLHNAQEKTLRRRIMLPQDMLQRLAVEVVQKARSEPYGLRGAVLYLDLEQEDGSSINLGRIECNSHVASTFEVNITLKTDIQRWCTIKDLVVRGLFGGKDTELYLAPSYTLVKHKLYRSKSAVSC